MTFSPCISHNKICLHVLYSCTKEDVLNILSFKETPANLFEVSALANLCKPSISRYSFLILTILSVLAPNQDNHQREAKLPV